MGDWVAVSGVEGDIRRINVRATEIHERAADAVEAASLVFNATASVNSPRQVGGVRSALLFEMLARLKAAGFSLSRQPMVVLREAGDATS